MPRISTAVADECLKMAVIGTNMPIAPKIDLVLGAEGLETVKDYDEIIQSVARTVIAQYGDSVFYPNSGVPWVRPQRGNAAPVFTSSDHPVALRRIELAVARAIKKDPRVVSAQATTKWNDASRRVMGILAKVILYDRRVFELEL